MELHLMQAGIRNAQKRQGEIDDVPQSWLQIGGPSRRNEAKWTVTPLKSTIGGPLELDFMLTGIRNAPKRPGKIDDFPQSRLRTGGASRRNGRYALLELPIGGKMRLYLMQTGIRNAQKRQGKSGDVTKLRLPIGVPARSE